MHKNVISTDVCVLDSSFTSCLVALLLAQKNISVTLIQPTLSLCPELNTSLPIFWPSLNDPPTRAVVAHGVEVAKFLNDFCQRGTEFFETSVASLLQLKPKRIPQVWRLGFADFETAELNKAVEQNLLQASNVRQNRFYEFGFGFYIDTTEVIVSIEKQIINNPLITVFKAEVERTEKPFDTCLTHCSNATMVKSELVVCNNDAIIRRLFPKFSEVLVPMTDVVFAASLPNDTKIAATLAARSSNGHAAACLHTTESNIKIWLSGPRFLLPQAGANILLKPETLTDELKSRLIAFHTSHLIKEFAAVFPNVDNIASNTSWQASFDYDSWPCDEMPILGDLGLAGRALGSAGWLATRLSSGCAAAQMLTDFVFSGKTKHAHPLLDPRRLFIA